MSIAVSALVRPSRILFAMVAGLSTTALLVSIAIIVGLLGDQSQGFRLIIGTSGIFLALFGFYHGVRDRKTIQLDISGTGQMRISEIASRGACSDAIWPHVRNSGELVSLRADSTIWPNLLLLRLQSVSGRLLTLPILPDCVSQESFRSISVACRWIAGQKNTSSSEAP